MGKEATIATPQPDPPRAERPRGRVLQARPFEGKWATFEAGKAKPVNTYFSKAEAIKAAFDAQHPGLRATKEKNWAEQARKATA